MPAFYLTFGQEYPDEKLHERWLLAHHDGWLTIMAEDLAEATRFAQSLLGTDYSNIVGAEELIPQMYPKGELGRIGHLHHSPVERFYQWPDGTRRREISCSCSTYSRYIRPIPWGIPGHGERRTTP